MAPRPGLAGSAAVIAENNKAGSWPASQVLDLHGRILVAWGTTARTVTGRASACAQPDRPGELLPKLLHEHRAARCWRESCAHPARFARPDPARKSPDRRTSGDNRPKAA
jgi:hypothetical protein